MSDWLLVMAIKLAPKNEQMRLREYVLAYGNEQLRKLQRKMLREGKAIY